MGAGAPDAADWLRLLADSGRAPATINQRVSIVRSFHRWAGDEDFTAGRVKEPERVARALSIPEIARILDACDILAPRIGAMIALMVTSGIRVDEACGLELRHVDLAERRATLVGKGGKMRTIRYGAEAGRRIARWLEVRPASDYLFCTSSGGQVDAANFRKELARASWWADVEPAVRPHDLRRTFATQSVRSKLPIADLKEMLGHSSVVTTERYVGNTSDRAWSDYDGKHALAGEISPEG